MLSHFLRKFSAFGPAAAVVRAGGRRWRLALGAAVPDLGAAGVVVKSNPYRTISRVELADGAVYVKHLRPHGLRAWFREVLRPPKARLEFENALALAARGVGTVEPLACGEADTPWPGDSVLVTRARDEAVPFPELLAALPTPAVRRAVAAALGRFVAKLHDAGVTHPDPHPGNLLAELPAHGPPRFFLLDLHAVRFSAPLPWPEARANLVLLNRWFQLRASRADRYRFWEAYRAARHTGPLLTPAHGRDIETATAASNLRFWAARVRDCLGRTRHFARVPGGYAVKELAGTWEAVWRAGSPEPPHPPGPPLRSGEGGDEAGSLTDSPSASAVPTEAPSRSPEPPHPPGPPLRSGEGGDEPRTAPGVPGAGSAPWLGACPYPLRRGAGSAEGRTRGEVEGRHARSPDSATQPPHGVRVLKDSRTSLVTAFALPDGRRVVLKQANVRRWWEPLKNLFRPSSVLRSWVAGHALRDRWLPTPRPLAVAHRRRFGLPAEGFLLVEEVPDAVGLPEAVAAGADVPRLVHALARVVRQMHDRHVSHRDLKAANLMLANGTDPVFIDLVGVRVGRAVSVRQRAKELARLNASFLRSPRVRHADRVRFVRAYLAAGPAIGGDWRSWWKQIAAATAAKVAKNVRSGRVLN